jgi:hypothetical protein
MRHAGELFKIVMSIFGNPSLVKSKDKMLEGFGKLLSYFRGAKICVKTLIK